jgi:hypothetical protein
MTKIQLRSEPATPATREKFICIGEGELTELMLHWFDQGMKSAKLGNDKEARKLARMLATQHVDAYTAQWFAK